jgi:tyrosyl-tRNA synthetase
VVVLIVGDYTARVGDPSGRSTLRPVLSGDEIDANARTYAEQAFNVLDRDRTEMRFNSEWLDMKMEELFRLTRTTTVAQILERDDFAKRYAANEPISVLELLYPLMQGYDSVAVRSDVELGGTDQKFNLLLARDIQRAYGLPEQVALTMPLLTGVDGDRKMSKSFGNHVGVTDAPEEQYGKTMRIPDAAMESWYGLLLGEPLPDGVSARDAKHLLARRIVERFHGPQEAERAAAHFEQVFVRGDQPDEIAEVLVAVPPDGALLHLPALIAEHVGGSRSEARRLIAQGAVRLDGEVLGGSELDLPAERLDGRVLQVGRRQFRRLRTGRPSPA